MSAPMTEGKPDEKRHEFAEAEATEHLEVDERGEDYANNVNARLQNPLYGLSREGLSKKVALFTAQSGLEDERELFEKAAILAQHPEQFEEQECLDEDDKYHLRRETTHKWKQPFALYFTVAVCSLSACVQGWDQTGSNGANLGFPQALGIDNSPGAPNREYHEWLVGIINAGPYLACVGLSCWISDPLNNWLGRRGVIFFCGIFCTLSVIGSAFSQTWQQLFITRLLLGIGMGPKASTTPIYAAENVPANIRGGLVMSWQLWTAFGIFLGFCANMAMADVGRYAWRYQLGSAFLPAIPMTIAIYFCPESPRWLMKKGRYPKAFRSFCRLRNSRIQAARDMFSCWAALEEERAIMGGTTYFGRVRDLFVVPRIRRATLGAFTVMIAQQMCGINIIAFYSSTIFVEAGYTPRNALKASLGFGAINFLFAFPAIFTIDTFGRRNLLLLTFPNMAWTLLAAGLCFLIPREMTAHLGLIAFFIYLFAAFYSPGEGPVPFTYSAEVFPLTHREIGMGFAVATCLGFSALLSISFPSLVLALTTLGAFCFYAGLNILALVAIFLFVPETAGRTLEELDAVFSVPTSVHARYQVKEALPYFIKRWIKRDKSATLRPLYDFGNIKSITVFEKGAGH